MKKKHLCGSKIHNPSQYTLLCSIGGNKIKNCFISKGIQVLSPEPQDSGYWAIAAKRQTDGRDEGGDLVFHNLLWSLAGGSCKEATGRK